MIESQRIRKEYQRRAREVATDFYSLVRPVNAFFKQQRTRHVQAILQAAQLLPLENRRILEIGCGAGGWLTDFEAWGARRGNLAGIDLDERRVAEAQRLLSANQEAPGMPLRPAADIRLGDASDLPWTNASFDVVVQSTVFTSVLDRAMKKALAAEMLRVLKPEGLILWYDFCYNNPLNPGVQGVRKGEISLLFPDCRINLRRITLAPPLARKLVPLTLVGALMLEKLRFLNTHYLGAIRKRGA